MFSKDFPSISSCCWTDSTICLHWLFSAKQLAVFAKYFLNLEKRHYKSSVITQLKVSDTDFITSDNEILNECETFYRNIYSSKTNSLDSGHLFFDATGLPSLDPEEKEKCEGPLTKTECFQALKSLDRMGFLQIFIKFFGTI